MAHEIKPAFDTGFRWHGGEPMASESGWVRIVCENRIVFEDGPAAPKVKDRARMRADKLDREIDRRNARRFKFANR